MSDSVQLKNTFSQEIVTQENTKLKVFISYSHLDNSTPNTYIDQFKKHISPLKENGLIVEWYDRELLVGDTFLTKIDNNLDDADVICLFISANFLSSPSCKNEKKKALELMKMKGIPVIPIILSPCGWKDDADISNLLVAPTDGMAVSDFENSDTAWHDVYNNLKKRIEKEIRIKELKLNEPFEVFLQDSEMLTQAHSHKQNVFLDDIFIPVELDKYDNLKEYKEKISSDELLTNILEYGKITIVGDNQSGKTTLCKRLFSDLRKLNFIPVYVSDKNKNYAGIMENKILKSLHEQYVNIEIDDLDKSRIVPIIDDFHHATKKDNHIQYLSNFPYCVIIVDDIFSLNIKDDTLSSLFTSYKIKQLKPTLRYELIKKWVCLREENSVDDYKNLDKYIGLINSILGKNLGKGIMPAYPFFILSTIFTYEAFSMPLDREITSQGYCYEAFIYYYLKKHGVQNDEIDIYNNFLTELAAFIYGEKKDELTPTEFILFMDSYLEKYYLPIKKEILLKNLHEIVSEDSFRNYSFKYPYFYYFYVAKYLSENIDNPESKVDLENILNNLHVDKNAYIAVFLTHHSKSDGIIDEIISVASSLFNKYEPATLTKDEVKFFDEQAHNIVNAVLPPANKTPEKERTERLTVQDEMEESFDDTDQKEEIDDTDCLNNDLRRSIRTVEVMGCIIRNRAGSLEKKHVKRIFIEAMYVHLRSLSCFFDLIKSESIQNEMVDFISKKLISIEEREGSNKKLSEEKKKKLADIIFWNLNFFVVLDLIHKVVHSIGSDKLTEIGSDACDDVNTPASFLVKHGILMEYDKNPQIVELSKKINEDDFSKIADKVVKLMVVDYCSLNKINFKDRQRIIALLNIPQKNILPKGQMK